MQLWKQGEFGDLLIAEFYTINFHISEAIKFIVDQNPNEFFYLKDGNTIISVVVNKK